MYRNWMGLGIAATLCALATSGCSSDDSSDKASGASNGSAVDLGGTTADGATAEPTTAAIEGEDEEATPPDTTEETVSFNAFVMSAYDPQSTFAADVDTASYDVFRQYATLYGELPPPEYVRVEEWINYFKYAYPAPSVTSEVPFAINLAAGPSLTGNDTLMLRVGIQGRDAPEESKKPANIVYLVDTSGSMASAEKLPLVQLTLTESLEVLDPDDTLAIVTYAGSTRVALEPTPVSERDAIAEVINNLDSGGSTAGAAGLDLAYQQAEAGFIEGGINHVVICTDGDFNVGPSSTEELVALIEEKRESGVTLTALGFGQNNDQMMELVSNAGNGIYGVIIDEDHAIEYVHEKLLSSLVHIAKDVKLQVEFNPELVLAYRLIGYENRAIADEDFRNDLVDAGEIGASHRVTALYELVLVGSEVPAPEGAPDLEDGDASDLALEVSPNDLLLVKIRYKQPGASAEDEASEVEQALGPDEVAENREDLDADARWASAVASYAELVRGNPYVSMDELDTIAEIISDQAYQADSDRSEFVTLFDETRDLL